MPAPVVVPREDHPISRRDIDADALRVLYRLQQQNHVAYLVGGSVRDLILGRRPKDFDIGTDAHPYQIKRLFRNCWIIGRRFRLAHIKFGQKTIEVATFRKNVTDLSPESATEDATLVASSVPPVIEPAAAVETGEAVEHAGRGHVIVHRDNTFGTPEEDAFRRDFTINALFYDVATKSVIDYVGGLGDLEQRIIRSIGDPRVRFAEDPVRMLRAVVFGARLGFDLDVLVVEAIAEMRHLISTASPARLLDEYYKILRSGWAEESFRALSRTRLLELMTPELKSPPAELWDSLARLDRFRQRFPSAPVELTNVILIGSLLHPIGALNRRLPDRGSSDDAFADRVSFGALPVARKDVDRLRQLLQTAPRLSDPNLPPRVVRGLPHRPSFIDAVTWLDVFGDDPDAVEPWKVLRAAQPPRPAHGHGRGPRHGPRHGPRPSTPHESPPEHRQAAGTPPAGGGGADGEPRRRRRRRRRRRGRGRGPGTGPAAA